MAEHQSTADQVLDALKLYNLENENDGKYRANRPWSSGSDSMGLTIKIDGPEYGTFCDHVTDEGGSLYDLAERLNIQTPGKNGRYPVTESKRAYSGLDDYAKAHGVEAKVFGSAGWEEATYPYDGENKGRPALVFPTQNGKRFRFLDGKKPTFISPRGYKACWFGLNRAVEDAGRSRLPLVITGGEPSVVTAQHYGVPACATTGSETKQLPGNLLGELEEAWSGNIVIAPDCDPTGVKMGQGINAQFSEAGYSVRVVNLNGDDKFDLADFCSLHQFDSMAELLKLNDLPVDVEEREKLKSHRCTDLGNAEDFVRHHKQDVRFCHLWEKWLIWDGKRWAVDGTGRIRRKAEKTIRLLHKEASESTVKDKRKAMGKQARMLESYARTDAMLRWAKAKIPISVDDLDQHPMLLNVANGTIDLQSGQLFPHARNDLLTKLIDVEFDPDGECPEWLNFIDLVSGGDKELAIYLQQAVGYSLTGLTDEHCLFFLHGGGKNGKSTFADTIRRLMGDYAQRTDIESLMLSWNIGKSANPHIANMAGARFVLASEIPENRKLNESLVKDLTGGDTLTARFLFSNPFTFTAVHKLWLFGNYTPKISGTDEGIWRRMHTIPFRVTIPDDVCRPMSEVIQMFEDEMSGILSWAVRGCLFWQSSGKLETPSAVKDATTEYRNEQDILQQFIDELCEMHPDFRIEKKALYSAWRKWCEDAGEEQARRRSKKWFTTQFTRRRGLQTGGSGKSFLIGIRLKDE